MIHITLASNAIHLEAARRLQEGLLPARKGLALLLWEPGRFQLSPADRRRWPVRLPARPVSYLLLAPWALLGLVGELRLAHRRDAGAGLRLLLARARRLTLLDDGLDQYRAQPKAVDPLAFPAGTECWLFSDAPSWRAPWCGRFRCRELGPLFTPAHPGSAGVRSGVTRGLPQPATLIIDSPGVEQVEAWSDRLPKPWCLVPHPVAAKRSWRLPPRGVDRCLPPFPETMLPQWRGTVVVGESRMLLAALRLRAPGTQLVLALPPGADAHFRRLVAAAAARDPLVSLVEPVG
ncbi:MAG: hypothetical protein VKP70_01610 [Cyanobacteriota bacterium]|nr:hypothetical protein [Cyanobacteriota bacterium]